MLDLSLEGIENNTKYKLYKDTMRVHTGGPPLARTAGDSPLLTAVSPIDSIIDRTDIPVVVLR